MYRQKEKYYKTGKKNNGNNSLNMSKKNKT